MSLGIYSEVDEQRSDGISVYISCFFDRPSAYFYRIFSIMKEEHQPQSSTQYTTEISGENSTNFIGGQHTHSSAKPIARPTLDKKGTETFVGRNEQLAELHRLFGEESQVAIAAATTGMGGVGKTELAVQYAVHYDADYPGGVWWLSGRGDLVGQVLSYATRMGLAATGPSSSDVQKVQECYAFWQQGIEGRRLVIVDDVTTVADYEAVLPYLPTEASFRVLLTTRERLEVRRLDLGVLEAAQAIELLVKLVGAERIEAEQALSEELCDWLGYLPLGLELVGRYLAAKPRTTVTTLLERLKGQRLAAKALLRGQPMTATHGSLAAAFEVSWVGLEAETQFLGAVLSLFGLAEIPQDVVRSCLVGWEEEAVEEAWDRLENLHLVGMNQQLHPMLREFLAVKLDAQAEGAEVAARYVAAMGQKAQTLCKQTMNRDEVQVAAALVPHWVDVVERQSIEVFGLQVAAIANNLSLYYYAQGIFKSGEQWSEADLAISEKQLGPEHPDTGTSLNNLAGLYESMGRYEAAEPLYLRALAIREKQLGPEHPSTGTSLNNLAGLYRSMGRYEAAEPLYLRALAISEKQLGPEHPDTGTSLNNLAGLYESMGRYEAAEPLYLRALAIGIQYLGEDHPDVAIWYNNIAGLYTHFERYAEAESLYHKALQIFLDRLPQDHPYVTGTFNGLANLIITAHTNGQTNQLSEHPMTQAILQQIRSAG
jgi:tetratricopeptide (TPR) repeat protein